MEKAQTSNVDVGKYLKVMLAFITCQIFAAGRGEEDPARNPVASYLENKQGRVNRRF